MTQRYAHLSPDQVKRIAMLSAQAITGNEEYQHESRQIVSHPQGESDRDERVCVPGIQAALILKRGLEQERSSFSGSYPDPTSVGVYSEVALMSRRVRPVRATQNEADSYIFVIG